MPDKSGRRNQCHNRRNGQQGQRRAQQDGHAGTQNRSERYFRRFAPRGEQLRPLEIVSIVRLSRTVKVLPLNPLEHPPNQCCRQKKGDGQQRSHGYEDMLIQPVVLVFILAEYPDHRGRQEHHYALRDEVRLHTANSSAPSDA